MELKPCPFCGGTDISIHWDEWSGTYIITCNECNADFMQYYEIREDAIAAWNRRCGDA